MTDDTLLALINTHAGEPAPRYTSYPTANLFQPVTTDTAYRAWLSAIDPAAPISLYVHIPFCAQQCWYCGCNMKLAARYEPVAAYVDQLLAEIDLVAAAAPSGLRFAHLHFGGGTPSVLKQRDLERILCRLARAFTAEPDAEVALEIDPRTADPDLLSVLGTMGFNRASLGVQEFSPTVQQAINRVQSAQTVGDCVTRLRAGGVAAINFDLLYGLPHQTEESLATTIETCLAMAPDRVALFGYAHVPWFAKNQRMIPEEALPALPQRARQMLRARRLFQAAGYGAIGIDHFAAPTDPLAIAAQSRRLHRNFQGYTTDAADVLLGFGATAIGQTPAGFVQNIAETGAYGRAIAEGRLPVERGLAITDEDRLRAGVIEAIMCGGPVDLAAAALSGGRPQAHFDAALVRVQHLAAEGLVRLDGRQLSLTEAGVLLARLVAACFDAHRTPGPGKHAVAV